MAVFKVLPHFALLVFDGRRSAPCGSESTPADTAPPKPLLGTPARETHTKLVELLKKQKHELSVRMELLKKNQHELSVRMELLKKKERGEREPAIMQQMSDQTEKMDKEEAKMAEALAVKCQSPSGEHAEARVLSQEAAYRELECSSDQAGVDVIDLTNDADTDHGGHHLARAATTPPSNVRTPTKARRTIY